MYVVHRSFLRQGAFCFKSLVTVKYRRGRKKERKKEKSNAVSELIGEIRP
jgi:hypothetical protein